MFLRARYYEPSLGSFIKQDPMEIRNYYAYVSGNPINRVDPSGLLDWCTGEVHSGDTLNTIYSPAVGLGYPPQPPHLPLEEVMRLLAEANVGNYPFYQEGISTTGIAYMSNWDLQSGEYYGGAIVTHINIPEQVRRAAGISCSTSRIPDISCPPPQLECPEGYTFRAGDCYPIIPTCPMGYVPRLYENPDNPNRPGYYVCECNSYGNCGMDVQSDPPTYDECSLFFMTLENEANTLRITQEQLMSNPSLWSDQLGAFHSMCISDIVDDMYTIRPCLRDPEVARSAGLDTASILSAGTAQSIGIAISLLGFINTANDSGDDALSVGSSGIGLYASLAELHPAVGIGVSTLSLLRTIWQNCGVEERDR